MCQPGDAPDIAERDRVDSVAEHQGDGCDSNGLIVSEGPHASTSGHDYAYPSLAFDTQIRHWRNIAPDQASMLVAA